LNLRERKLTRRWWRFSAPPDHGRDYRGLGEAVRGGENEPLIKLSVGISLSLSPDKISADSFSPGRRAKQADAAFDELISDIHFGDNAVADQGGSSSESEVESSSEESSGDEGGSGGGSSSGSGSGRKSRRSSATSGASWDDKVRNAVFLR
jgi:hypothetical protein